jgi:uncharacterized DUF497 family protein
MLTWDEPKRQKNLRKHGLDFTGCDAVFDHPTLTTEDNAAFDEQRIRLLGWLDGRVVHLTYTERGETLHVISLREATRHEARLYFEAVSHKS